MPDAVGKSSEPHRDDRLLAPQAVVGLEGRGSAPAAGGEAPARGNENVFRHLIDTVPHLVWMAHPDGSVFFYNQQARHYSGFNRDTLGARIWAAVLHPDDVQRTADAWRLAVQSETPYEVEHRFRMHDGTYRWHVSRALPMLDGDGAIEKWYGTATDIHRVKEAEAALSTNEERLRRAQKLARVGTWDIDLASDEVTWSEGVFDLVGLPSEGNAPSADTWMRCVHPDDRDLVDRKVKVAIAQGGTYENELRVVRPDGEVVWLAARGYVLHDASGRPVRFLGVNYDITSLKRTEAALRELNETLEERVHERTQAVHEREARIRELSRAVLLAEQRERHRIAYLLHDDLQQVLVAARFAAGRNEERLDDLLDEALRLTRSLSHELSPPLLEGEDIGDLFRWLAEQYRKQHGLEVVVEARGHNLPSEPDLRVLLYQVVRELLFNVVKHAGTNRVRITAEQRDDLVCVEVEDAGRGFDTTPLQKGRSVGLGLPKVRERLELVGGTLRVDSEPGSGTCIYVRIPLRAE